MNLTLMPSPSISVVIPTYNALATLGRALASVAAQTYAGVIEIIVVDDGSAEDTAGFLRQNFPHVVCLSQEHSAIPGSARNRGVAASRGELIAFLDADDEWLDHKLATQVQIMASQPDVELVLARSRTCLPDGRLREPPASGLADIHQLSLQEHLSPSFRREHAILNTPSSWLLTRRLYDELGGQDTHWPAWGDWHFIARTLLAQRPVALAASPLLIYHNSLTSFASSPEVDFEAQTQRAMAFLNTLQPGATGSQGLLAEATYERIIFENWSYFALHRVFSGHLRLAASLCRRAGRCRVPLRQRLPQLALLCLLALPAALSNGRCEWSQHLLRSLRALKWGLRAATRRCEAGHETAVEETPG